MKCMITAWKAIFVDEDNQFNKDFVLFILFFFLGCFIYFAKIVTDLPNPDAVWNGLFFKDTCGWEISLGRYLIGVLQKLRTYTINTVFITLTCMALLSLINIYIIKIFNIRTLGWKLIAGSLIMISPTVGSTLTYYYCSDFYMLSYFLAVLAVWFMIGEGKARLFAASICLMCSAAIYQAYISLSILICFMYLMKLLLDPEIEWHKITKKTGRCLLGGILGIGMYLISNKLVQHICSIEAEENRGFSKMGMIHAESILEQLGQCYRNFIQYYFEDSMINNLCGFRREINIVFFFLLECLILGITVKSDTAFFKKLLFIIMCSLYPIIVMSICILAPEVSVFETTGVLMLPTMNYIYVFAVVLIQRFVGKEFYYILNQMGILAAVSAVFVMLLQLELGGQAYIKHNMLKTYHVASQIEERAGRYGSAEKRLCIIGDMERGNYPENYPELAKSQQWVTAGHRIIWSDFNGSQSCWHEFIKQYLGKDYTMCTKVQYDAILETPEYLAMSFFPEEGGVILVNDTVVVKLSEP